MEQKKYRVEVFITPKINGENTVIINKNNAEKIVNKLQIDTIEEVSEHDESITDEKEIFNNSSLNEKGHNVLKETKNIESNTAFYTNEKIYDEPFVGNLSTNAEVLYSFPKPGLNNFPFSSKKYMQKYIPKPPKRTSSLKSIDERVEIWEQNLEDFCYHGNKNGCTVAVQKPEEVSQEIFKENWLQKLESLRQREALLRDKEIALQSQERLLFKKERQLRILERLVKDKMKQADLYLRRCKNIQGFENIIDNEHTSESGISNSSKDSKLESNDEKSEKDDDVQHIYDEIRNPPNSKSSLITEVINVPKPPISLNSERPSRFTTHSSFRYKPRPKLSYDDLNSTLSADVGDSSFVVTSRKFNPQVFKKPIAFTRSASERRPKLEQEKDNRNLALSIFPSNSEHCHQETKILKKVSENILVSQNKETKFQNYGLIDDGIEVNCNAKTKNLSEGQPMNCKKYSYLDLESGSKTLKIKNRKVATERPMSWSAETDDWLQKKRRAYNMTVGKISMDHLENKENKGSHVRIDVQSKPAKKDKGRKFLIFR